MTKLCNDIFEANSVDGKSDAWCEKMTCDICRLQNKRSATFFHCNVRTKFEKFVKNMGKIVFNTFDQNFFNRLWITMSNSFFERSKWRMTTWKAVYRTKASHTFAKIAEKTEYSIINLLLAWSWLFGARELGTKTPIDSNCVAYEPCTHTLIGPSSHRHFRVQPTILHSRSECVVAFRLQSKGSVCCLAFCSFFCFCMGAP